MSPTMGARVAERDRVGTNKALIIGIGYGSRESLGVRKLVAPHKDARDFRAHLIRECSPA